MARFALLSIALVMCVLAGCTSVFDRESDGLFEEGGPLSEEEQAEVKEQIANLSAAASPEDPDAEAVFNDAVQNLTLRGSSIEPLLIEALAGSEDWAIRYGVINVLDGVGTRSSVEPLIAVLDDNHYLVALKAMYLLRVICDHQEIPNEGVSANGLPAVPPANPDDLDVDAWMKSWIRWHDKHGTALRETWAEWWRVHSGRVIIE
ncbi:MAG: HEAT repeat domain-containing protein [Planctomycetota bacterium]|jgi:HEAT repeat protein|nr:HEAT repeat domain-containing protein [Planctomycetota bacterium]